MGAVLACFFVPRGSNKIFHVINIKQLVVICSIYEYLNWHQDQYSFTVQNRIDVI